MNNVVSANLIGKTIEGHEVALKINLSRDRRYAGQRGRRINGQLTLAGSLALTAVGDDGRQYFSSSVITDDVERALWGTCHWAEEYGAEYAPKGEELARLGRALVEIEWRADVPPAPTFSCSWRVERFMNSWGPRDLRGWAEYGLYLGPFEWLWSPSEELVSRVWREANRLISELGDEDGLRAIMALDRAMRRDSDFSRQFFGIDEKMSLRHEAGDGPLLWPTVPFEWAIDEEILVDLTNI